MKIEIEISPAKFRALQERLAEVGPCLPEAAAAALVVAFAESAPPSVTSWIRTRLQTADSSPGFSSLWESHKTAIRADFEREFEPAIQLAGAVRRVATSKTK